jgi:hypothetical protein
MNILATVKFGNPQITQSWKFLSDEPWEFLDGKQTDFLVLMVTEYKKCLAIPLDKNLIRDLDGNKCYLGTLNVSDAAIV